MKKFLLLYIILFLSVSIYAADKTSQLGEAEIELGKRNVEEIAKTYKFLDNPYYVEKVNRIGNELAKIVNENKINATYGSDILTPFNYEFRVVEGDDINAFSVSGGFIYVYKGMIDFCESDDELAGIIAHEIIHAAHHHLIYLYEEQTKYSNQALLGLLVGVIAARGNAEAISGIATASNMYAVAMTNGYSQEAERDSDQGAFYLMQKSKYNPVGLLTPLERLAQTADLVDYGIYRTHPVTKERVYNVKKLLNKYNIPIDRYKVCGRVKGEIKDETKNNINVKSLYISGKYVISEPCVGDGADASSNLAQIVIDTNNALRNDIEIYNLKKDADTVYIKKIPVFTPTDEQISASGKSKEELLKNYISIMRNHLIKRDMAIII